MPYLDFLVYKFYIFSKTLSDLSKMDTGTGQWNEDTNREICPWKGNIQIRNNKAITCNIYVEC